MKGILLAGGTGSRLGLMTKSVNKHCLGIWDRPMIFYPLQTLINAGIEDILIVTGTEHMGTMVEILGSGSEFGADLTYRVQDSSGGIAEALLLAKSFANEDSIAVILGDNFFEDGFGQDIEGFQAGAKVFLKRVPDPERFGIAEIVDHKIVKIVEKPVKPKSDLAVTGLYLFDWQVFDFIEEQEYSLRKELEITDTNLRYLETEDLEYRVLEHFWSDMGTPKTLLLTSIFIANKNIEVK